MDHQTRIRELQRLANIRLMLTNPSPARPLHTKLYVKRAWWRYYLALAEDSHGKRHEAAQAKRFS